MRTMKVGNWAIGPRISRRLLVIASGLILNGSLAIGQTAPSQPARKSLPEVPASQPVPVAIKSIRIPGLKKDEAIGLSAGFFEIDFPKLDNAIELVAINAPAMLHYEKARELQQSGKWREAIIEASHAVRLSPDDTDMYRLRSDMFAVGRLYRRVIADRSRVIDMGDANSYDFIFRGWAYAQDRDFDRGLADLATAYQMSANDDNRSFAMRYRGSALEGRGDFEQALEAYQRADKLRPNQEVDLLGQGRCLARLGRHELAIAALDRAIAIHPDPMTWALRGESRLSRGEVAQALADYEQAIEVKPEILSFTEGRAWCLLAMGQVDRAINEFTLAINGSAPNPMVNRGIGTIPGSSYRPHRAYTGRGWAYLAKKDYEEAKANFDQAISMQPCGSILMGSGWDSSFALQPLYDRAVAEFNQRCLQVPNLRWALMIWKEQDARSQALENPYLVVNLVCRSRPDPALAPNILFQFTMDWKSFPDARSAYFGRALTALAESQGKEALENLEIALNSWREWKSPGSTRPPFAQILREL